MMMSKRLNGLLGRVVGTPLNAESLVRGILLLGFFVLLLLIGALGYWGTQSFVTLEKDVARLHEAEANHLRTVLRISETEGQLVTEARALLATRGEELLEFPSKQNLKDLKRQMDEIIEAGRKGSLGQTREWANFEAAFNAYWLAINSSEPEQWPEERDRLENSIDMLDRTVAKEREENDRIAEALSKTTRRKVAIATVGAVVVGFLVAGLTFYEIRRILKQLSTAYKESAESRDYLQSLFDSLVSGAIVITQDGVIQTANDSFSKLTGLGVASNPNRDYRRVFKDKPALMEHIKHDLEKQPQASRYYCRVELGDERLFDVFSSPLLIAGEQQGLILVFVDVTDIERAQSELRRNRALAAVGQMTAQIAHEIKNPLGSIRFATELLKRHKPADANGNEEVIQTIERSVDHLATIVMELSEFARPKELNRTETNLNQLLEDLIPMLADRLAAKAMKIEKAYAQSLPPGHYDKTELRKLFLNLIINAIDASSSGGVVELKTKLDGEQSIRVDVVDKGRGMDSETLRRLFEPFYTTKKSGTGLGMAIAKKIAELHRGDLLVESKQGQGTIVSVRLPLD